MEPSKPTYARIANDAASPRPATPNPIELDVLKLVYDAQQAHGMRANSDYLRYRKYCSRRLHSLRVSAGMQRQRNGGKPRRAMPDRDSGDLKPVHIKIMLFSAERAVRNVPCTPGLPSTALFRPTAPVVHPMRELGTASCSPHRVLPIQPLPCSGSTAPSPQAARG